MASAAHGVYSSPLIPTSGYAPLHVHRVTSKAPPLTLGVSLLQSFIHPCTLTEFTDSHLDRAHAFIGGGPKRVEELLCTHLHNGDLQALLEDTPSQTISAWLVEGGGGSGSGSGSSSGGGKNPPVIQTLKLQDAASAATAYRCGASLYFRAPQPLADEIVPLLGEALGMPPCTLFHDATTQDSPRGEVETFATRKGHVTGWHTDFQHNFTIQLQGAKKWRVRRGAVLNPLRAMTPHYATPGGVVEEQFAGGALAGVGNPSAMGAEIGEVVLRPGDAFFFPAGLWHEVTCLEDSLSINVSLVGLSWADLCGGIVRQAMWRSQDMRGLVRIPFPEESQSSSSSSGKKRPRGEGGEGEAPTREFLALQQAQRTLAYLRATVADLTPQDLLPPVALLSKRLSTDIPGGGGGGGEEEDGEEEDEEEEDEEDEEKEEGPDTIDWAVQSNGGYKLRFDESGHLQILVPPMGKGDKSVSVAVQRSSLAVILPLGASMDYSGPGSPPLNTSPYPGFASFTILQHYGTGGEDLAPLIKCVLHIPHGFEAQLLGKGSVVKASPPFVAALKFVGLISTTTP